MADTSLVFSILAKDQTGRTFSKIGAKAKVAFAIAGAAVAGYVASAVSAAAEDAQAQAILANTLKKTAGARDSDVASVEGWISALTLATGVADDELRPALGNLVRATGDTAKAQDLLKTAMDVSAATGKPLASVSTALAKAADGNTGALGRLVPGLKDADGKALSFKKSVEKLNGQFGGSQAAKTDSFAGQVQSLKNRFNETKESVGTALLPILKNLMDFVTTTAIPAFSALSGWVQQNSAWLKPLAVALGIAAGAIYIVNGALKAWAAIQVVLNAVLSANPLGLVVLAIAALVAFVIIAYKKVGWFREGVKAMARFVVRAFDWIKKAAGVLWDILKTVFKWSPYGIIIDNFGKIVEFFKKLPGRIKDVFSGLADIITWPFRTAFNAVASLWNSTVGNLSFTIPSWIPGVGGKGFTMPKIPQLAEGGIVTGPTLALIGEAGPEAVVPLGKKGGMGGNTYVMNFNGPVAGEKVFVELLRKHVRTAGGGDVQVALGR